MPAAQVAAAASDPVSVSVAYALGARIAIIGAQSSTAHAETQQAAEHLNANASDYIAQEQANAAGLNLGGVPAAAAASTIATPIPAAPPAFPAPQSATAPASGKQIAQLIHGGPGPAPLHDAASRLRSHAEQLNQTSAQLREAATNLQAGWFSQAGEAAQKRISELVATYDQLAQTTTAAATQADAQADNVSRARSAIPRPEEFNQLESRLQAAVRANAQSKGAYSAVVAQLQNQLAALNAKAAAGYTDYTTDAETGIGSIQAVDWKTAPPEKPNDAKGDDDNKHGGSKSIGKGSKTHIEVRGDQERQWGTPTDPHEVAGGSGSFDSDRGGWQWHGPGYQGGATASEHTDGITGKAGAGAWIAKGDVSWSGDVFGHPLTASANAEAGANASADVTITDHGASANAGAFVGVEAGAKSEYNLGPVDLSLDGALQYGAGLSTGFDVGMEDGKFVMGGTLGAAWGPGAKISPHIAIDPSTLTDGFKRATDWVTDLFG
jgi:hypothetical protein